MRDDLFYSKHSFKAMLYTIGTLIFSMMLLCPILSLLFKDDGTGIICSLLIALIYIAFYSYLSIKEAIKENFDIILKQLNQTNNKGKDII